MTQSLRGRRILLIIGGGIAAYKSLELIRRLREAGAEIAPVLTRGGAQFITPLSVAALSETEVYTDLFDLTREAKMGHIELSRSADLIVIAPATADLMAKMAQGLADDLATTLLLARDKTVLLAPSMNVRMWQHPATQRNLKTLLGDDVVLCGPTEGAMACGEFGMGRLAEVDDIMRAIEDALLAGPLRGRHIIVTSGATQEPIDPVRYLGNRSSGRQGAAIASALAALGARVSFITGAASAEPPAGCEIIPVQTALEMQTAVMAALPADAAIMAAAVADWRVKTPSKGKMKKSGGGAPSLELVENPDILAQLAGLKSDRPKLVIGFAAETEALIKNARAKYKRKGCDWLIANDVSAGAQTMGTETNEVTLIRGSGKSDTESWPRMSKVALGHRLAKEIATFLES